VGGGPSASRSCSREVVEGGREFCISGEAAKANGVCVSTLVSDLARFRGCCWVGGGVGDIPGIELYEEDVPANPFPR
jgi:hypothetical protein